MARIFMIYTGFLLCPQVGVLFIAFTVLYQNPFNRRFTYHSVLDNNVRFKFFPSWHRELYVRMVLPLVYVQRILTRTEQIQPTLLPFFNVRGICVCIYHLLYLKCFQRRSSALLARLISWSVPTLSRYEAWWNKILSSWQYQ